MTALNVGDEMTEWEQVKSAPAGTLFAVTDPDNFPGETHFALATRERGVRWIYRDGVVGIGAGLLLDRPSLRRVMVHALDVPETAANLRAAMRWGPG